MRLVEVYKSSQNMESGKFVRLVGTMALRKKGYPFLFLDAAVTNINMQTGEVADLGTRTAIHMPQATESGRQALMASLSSQADEAKLPWGTVTIDALPSFWGPLWHVRMEWPCPCSDRAAARLCLEGVPRLLRADGCG